MLPGSCPTAGHAIIETSHVSNATIVFQEKNGVKLHSHSLLLGITAMKMASLRARNQRPYELFPIFHAA
jgi:hypothetical protein